MTTTEFTYGQLDKVLRSLGFTCRSVTKRVQSRRYEHKESGAIILLPAFPMEDSVVDYHLLGVRTTLDGFGVADPTDFDAKLKKAR